ncbi:MAG TPA: DUF1800 family protein, partial [Chthoniobacterales bacterium]|nr:DUF1800 family protein [Chthoniobacterales bacterium]
MNQPPRSLVVLFAFAAALGFPDPALARKPKVKPNASFVTQSVPAVMTVGQRYAVSITMQNTGTSPWAAGRCQLGSLGSTRNAVWGTRRVALNSNVATGGSGTFNFSVIAPKKPGSYNFQWRMAQGPTWFGSATPRITINVTASSPTPTPTATPIPTATPAPPPALGQATVYIAHLRAQSTGSTGTGTAILKLSEDETFATVAFSYSNLSSPVISKHVHGPASPGQSAGILFDLDTVSQNADGTYFWSFRPVGTNTVSDIVSAIKSGRTYFNVHSSLSPSGEILGIFNRGGGSQSVPVPTPPPALPGGTPTAEAAARFLNQCTCGATAPLIEKVQQQGFDAFLDEQFSIPASSNLAFLDAQTSTPDPHDTLNAWWTLAITAPDQVRQRVQFALNQILVTSFNNGTIYDHPEGMSTYVDLLGRGAFGNYRQLLEEVTLNPTMGVYLDMLRNDKANPSSGSHPNENYARELMQLFSVGLYQLNIDGSLMLNDVGEPIPTYGQPDVTGLAAVTTGWTFAGSARFWDWEHQDFRQPMMVFPRHHTPEAKSILSGTVIPANQTPQADLTQALDTIFNHPNVGKFIGRELIQRLVTSNPSPGYVYRVASAFDNNGQGVRGDMKAVIRAILLDYDARGPNKSGHGAGKLKEPVLRLTSLYRALASNPQDGVYSFWLADEFGQIPLWSPTVFNFFSPDYSAPGAIAQAGLVSPEFQITTETTVVEQANTVYAALFWQDIPLDLSYEESLAGNPPALVGYLDRVFMTSSMSPEMRSVLTTTIGQISVNNPAERVRSALWLVLNSPEYV